MQYRIARRPCLATDVVTVGAAGDCILGIGTDRANESGRGVVEAARWCERIGEIVTNGA